MTQTSFTEQPEKQGIRICVYGSLKRNGKLHPNLKEARFLGETTFPGRLYSLGPYPALKPAETETDVVHGEVYEVGDALLERLDHIEGHPWQYRREPIQTAHFGECQAYVYRRRLHAADKRIESGNYNVTDWK
jgi:gamma-glutamylcyclotransferase (GGCT)/AIG2-like uncharacterized protein YtfP